jgi:imidazolonepropionase-like amidohydrolase
MARLGSATIDSNRYITLSSDKNWTGEEEIFIEVNDGAEKFGQAVVKKAMDRTIKGIQIRFFLINSKKGSQNYKGRVVWTSVSNDGEKFLEVFSVNILPQIEETVKIFKKYRHFILAKERKKMKTFRLLKIFICLFLLSICSFSQIAFSASSRKLIVRGGKIYTITKGVLNKGMILIEDCKIKDIAEKIKITPDAQVLDVEGLSIFPGFVAANTREGLGQDLERDEEILFAPFFRAADGLTSYREIYGADEIIASGVTTVYTAPILWTWKAVAGEGCVFKLKDAFIPLRILSYSAGMQMDLSYPEFKRMISKRLNPSRTQMGLVASLRKYLQEAQNYMKSWENYERGLAGAKKPVRNFELEPLVKVLKGEVPARIECEAENEIRAALNIAEEFGLTLVLERCMEAYKFADELKTKKIPCIVGPIREGWGKTVEEKINTYRNPGTLAKARVKIALQTENFGNLLVYLRTLVIDAAYAVKYGLEEEEALKAITINAAEILGVEKRVGSIEVGKDADLVVWTGHPFDMKSKVRIVLIDGKIVFKT